VFSLAKNFSNHIPKYATLSHIWGADTEELNFRDLIEHLTPRVLRGFHYWYPLPITVPAIVVRPATLAEMDSGSAIQTTGAEAENMKAATESALSNLVNYMITKVFGRCAQRTSRRYGLLSACELSAFLSDSYEQNLSLRFGDFKMYFQKGEKGGKDLEVSQSAH
jgi:hypothetical protein